MRTRHQLEADDIGPVFDYRFDLPILGFTIKQGNAPLMLAGSVGGNHTVSCRGASVNTIHQLRLREDTKFQLHLRCGTQHHLQVRCTAIAYVVRCKSNWDLLRTSVFSGIGCGRVKIKAAVPFVGWLSMCLCAQVECC